MGQAPSKETEGKPVFSGKAGILLSKLLGTTQEEMLFRHEFVNLLDRWPGRSPSGKGDLFPAPEAERAALALRCSGRLEGKMVIMLGRNVARAFCVGHVPFFQVRDTLREGSWTVLWKFCVIPHPSGICRSYNSPEARAKASEFLRNIAR